MSGATDALAWSDVIDDRSRPASCACNHDNMSARRPLVGRAQRRFFRALPSSPAHQYSLVTMSVQPRRPARVMVNISSASPCFGPMTLCRSRSNSTPSKVQRDLFRPGSVAPSSRSNSRKKDGLAKLFMTRALGSIRCDHHRVDVPRERKARLAIGDFSGRIVRADRGWSPPKPPATADDSYRGPGTVGAVAERGGFSFAVRA